MNNKLKKMFLAMTLSVLWLSGFAQRTVSGVVTDNKNEPLVGVTIMPKGSSSGGAITDVNGRYSLTVGGNSPVLIFSYLGYVSQSLTPIGTTSM